MKIEFPDSFAFGTSTSAYQIETAFEHDWCNVAARDGYIFGRTTDHEKRVAEDVEIIASLAPHYRMSLMWSKLQREPFGELNVEAKNFYHQLLRSLRNRGVSIMLVLHHFGNASWFAKAGGWEKSENIKAWVDYAQKVVDEFGMYASSWNTFNEPNLYTSMGWATAEFPPFRRNLLKAYHVINNIAAAHEQLYQYIKNKLATPVGISFNCTVFDAQNWMGKIPAKFFDYFYMAYPSGLFKSLDFFGMSYYARISHDPFPITYILTPEKIKRYGKPHDDMWEYYPQGLKQCMLRFWNEFKKPIIITENGICTDHDQQRVAAIRDYMKMVHEAMQEGVVVHGYYHWSTWDNFEWSLGPKYKFGLYACDWEAKERKKKPSADVFSRLAYTRSIDIPD